ncbi:T9SS type B sorting domain-containing protein [uncultured Tenacibaculum sp.]|uniref:T9SS type B sorting domain-containing protein n=1 Tax=uncultured Tenacibaculum sp. TaxID=174713 RepID=UPI00260E4394|nr:T9SS type B sorting domain-containing protein [uncultured Tenacibaculum sp.]
MKKALLLLTIISSIHLFAQKEANIWYFGRNAGIDFNTSPPTALTDGQVNTLEGCSTFSDTNGNLLFYSDGITVWDKNHNIMKYSDGRLAVDLLGNPSSSQSGMIIPKPKSSTIYYLFTVDDGPSGPSSPGNGLNLYTIDISKNGGLGEVISGPVALSGGLADVWSEKVAAVRGTECDTFWVVSAVNNTFYAFKVDDTGVNTTPILSTVRRNITRRGCLKLSPDGTKLAIANQLGTANLYNFNATNGTIDPSSEVVLTARTDGDSYGVEFSVDSRKLYISTVAGFRLDLNDPPTTYRLFQFDLNSTNIPVSKSLIHQEIGFRGGLQLGPDSRIYVTIPLAFDDPRGDDPNLDVIENPTANARDIIFTKDAIDLGGKLSTQGFPPFISSLLLPIEIIDLTSGDVINNQDRQYCIGDSIEIDSGSVTGTGITYEWTFDNGTTVSTISNQPKLSLNNIDTNNNGIYTLTVNLTNDCGEVTKLEGTFTIEAFAPATASPIADINFCDIDGDGFNSFDFDTDISPIALGTLSNTQFEVFYYLDRIDAENNNTASAITSPYTNRTAFSSEDIYVRVHNKDAVNACFDITQFKLSVTSLPTPTQPADYEACDDIVNGGDTDGFFNNFILSSKDNEILGSLSSTQYNVSYHTTLTGAQTDNSTDSINKNSAYRNTITNEQTIYVRVENRANTNCFTVSEPGTSFLPFKLVVNPLPVIVNPNVLIEQCENDGDLAATINLTQAQINISNNHTNETFKYYPSQADAIADSAEISDPVNFSANNGDTVWVRTISDKNCYRISQLDISINFAADILYDREFTSCDDFLDADGNNTLNNDDTDGITAFDMSAAETEVKNLFAPAIRNDLNILFFETETDRDAVTNQIADISNYRNTNIPANTQQTIFIKIVNKNNNNCTGLSKLFIRTLPLPNFDVTSPQILCLNNLSSIEAENPDGNYNYEWTRNGDPTIIGNNQTLNLTQGGAYEVTAINTTTLCRRSKTIIINESIIASVNQNDVTIVDDSENNTISINNSGTNLGIGEYEFALQDENNQIVVDFQDSPRFENLQGGVYTLLIRDKNNCGIAQLDVSVLEFPDFFTPNNDGINDLWNVKGISSFFYPKSSINIFDRFGKLITSLQIDGEGWNGLYNGRNLPSNDYWFNIELTDRNGKTFTRRGHFSLLRK